MYSCILYLVSFSCFICMHTLHLKIKVSSITVYIKYFAVDLISCILQVSLHLWNKNQQNFHSVILIPVPLWWNLNETLKMYLVYRYSVYSVRVLLKFEWAMLHYFKCKDANKVLPLRVTAAADQRLKCFRSMKRKVQSEPHISERAAISRYRN